MLHTRISLLNQSKGNSLHLLTPSSQSILKPVLEFLLWISGLGIQLVSMWMRVQSLALISVLRIQHCHELCCRSQMQLGSHIAMAVASSCSSNSTPSTTGAALKRKGKNNFLDYNLIFLIFQSFLGWPS